MPRIVPITDLRNYTNVLNQVDVDKPVYLTRNGRGTYVISKIDDYNREETIEDLVKEIKKGEASLNQGKAVPLRKISQEFNIKL
jgi:PHD/YefM family antitoxin component YafN of YafNO toxin-antitoxin module